MSAHKRVPKSFRENACAANMKGVQPTKNKGSMREGYNAGMSAGTEFPLLFE